MLELAAGPSERGSCSGAVLLDSTQVVWVQAGGNWSSLRDLSLMQRAGAVMAGL